MDYKESREFLTQSMQFGSILGLERMELLMDEIGNPGRNIRYIHVAGTNGKGSVTTMTANCLAAGGFRVGVYTSPFIQRFAERIRVLDGRTGLMKLTEDEAYGEISDDDFACAMTVVKAGVERMLEKDMEHPTEFELTTAAAFLHYEKTACDWVVLETGLGGRLDSTNVILSPAKCVITAIGYDHMDRLGNTIEEISHEKAGIIKAGAKVIAYDPAEYASTEDAEVIRSVMEKQCVFKKADSLTWVYPDNLRIHSVSIDGQYFNYKFHSNFQTAGISSDDKKNNRVKSVISIPTNAEFFTPLLGLYQPMNCAVVIECCKDLVPLESIQTGIRLTRWPARMERLRKSSPAAFLDGGHNLQGATALRDTLDRLFSGRKIVFLCGVMKDKEYKKMMQILLSSEHYHVESVFCTSPDNPRALSSSDFAKTVSEILDNLPQSSYNKQTAVFFDDSVSGMTDRALQTALDRDAIFVAFGSLYMAGIIRERVLRDC